MLDDSSGPLPRLLRPLAASTAGRWSGSAAATSLTPDPFDHSAIDPPITQRARPLGDTTGMTRAIVIALLLAVAPTRVAASGQTLADLWDGRAKWELAAEKVGG